MAIIKKVPIFVKILSLIIIPIIESNIIITIIKYFVSAGKKITCNITKLVFLICK